MTWNAPCVLGKMIEFAIENGVLVCYGPSSNFNGCTDEAEYEHEAIAGNQ